MKDLSIVVPRVPFLKLVKESFAVYLHLLRLLWMLYLRGGSRSIEAIRKDGTRVDFSRKFRLDGTTFVLQTQGKRLRRIPASQIVEIEDKGDYGYR